MSHDVDYLPEVTGRPTGDAAAAIWDDRGKADPAAPHVPVHRRGLLARQAVPLVLCAVDAAGLVTGVALAGGVSAFAVFWVLIALVLGAGAGAYRHRISYSLLGEVPGTAARLIASAAIGVVVAQLTSSPLGSRSLLLPVAVALVTTLVLRRGAHSCIRVLKASGKFSHRTVVIGAGKVGNRIARTTQDHPSLGLSAVGFVDDRPMLTEPELSAPVLGTVSELASVITREQVDTVIIAFTQLRESEVVDLIRTCGRLQCEILLVPRLFELSSGGHYLEDVRGMPLVRLRRAAYRTAGWRLKRVFDVLVSSAVLLVVGLVMLAIAVTARVVHGPGVLFRQTRVGVDGRRFELLKFRSMRPADEAESATRWNISNDARLDRLGRFLRKTSLDELPQLFNIIRGDMSLVGPRPERPHFVAEFGAAIPHYPARHRVPCGLTGWAQINGLRGDTSIEERARFDNYYIENWSTWLDITILLRTFASLIGGS